MSETRDRAEGGIRGRFRVQVRGDVKEVALRQLAEGGPQALSINAIAKELGVSGPALYRYFASRDDLLTELVVDAYRDFAAALGAAVQRARRQRPPGRFRALATAYRAWANAQPHRYRLLFAAPVPGYDAQAARLVAAAQESMNILLAVLAEIRPERVSERPGPLDKQLARWARDRDLAGLDPFLGLGGVITWSRLHGLVSLEIEGNWATMGLDPDLLFDVEVTALLEFLTRGPRPPR